MQAVKRIVTVKKCVFYLAVFIACLIMFGQEAGAAEAGPPMAAPAVSVYQAFSGYQEGNDGGFHALRWGTQIPVSGTAISVTGRNYMRMGSYQQLTASCQNYNGDFIFTSSDTNIAKVTNTGTVTAVTGGSVTISVQTEPITGSSIVCRGTFKLTVYHASYSELSSIGVSLSGGPNMSPGVKQLVRVTPYPSNAYIEPGFQYECSDYKVATVDETGVLTAVGEGSATITVTSKDGRNIKASTSITVTKTTGISVAGLEIHGKNTMVIGEKQTVVPLVTPVNASVPTVTFTSSSESVATVSSEGVVSAVGIGTTEITVYTQDGSGVSRSFALTVVGQMAQKLTVKGREEMEVGDTQTLSVVIEPANTSNRTLKYTSSDINVATVSDKGYISANSVGTAVITVETTDGSNLRQQITIKVSEKKVKVTSIALNLPGSNELAVDETRVITAVVFPLDATEPELEWYSSNEDVVSVSDGEITGGEPGKAMVIASATDGTGISARISISVYEPKGTPKSISLDGNTKMVIDTEQTLAVVLNPERTEMPDLDWESSNEDILNVSDGVVSADGLGTAVITATDGEKLKASITIIVVNEETEDEEEAEEISFDNIGDIVELKEGESITVLTNYRVDSSQQYLTWKTSNSVVASVSQKGKITARRYGSATITVSTVDGEYREKIKVKVSKKVYKITFRNLTGKNKLQLKKGRSKIVKYSLQADGTKAASYTWATARKSIAKVNEKGRVAGVKKGKAKITLKIKLVNGKTLKKSFLAVVKK